MTLDGPKQLSLFKQAEELESTTDNWRPIRDDFNFCRLPLFALADQKRDRFRNIKYTYPVEANGRSFMATWEVRHDSELGLPTTFDRLVWWELCARYSERLRTSEDESGMIPLGSLSEFLRSIGVRSDGGKMIARLKESIRRLTLTKCLTEKAFNCPESGGYLQLVQGMHLIEAYAFKGDVDGNGNMVEESWVKLGDYVRKNLKSGYIALLNLKFIRSLKGELAKQLYPFLSYRFWLASQHGRDHTSIHWTELATYLAVTGWDNLRRAKQRLSGALDELKAKDYIDTASDWTGEKYVFKIGDQFIDELKSRLKAKEQYKAWIEGKRLPLQLSVLPRPSASTAEISQSDERESVLIRQAIRINQLKQEPNSNLLAQYGWTVQDAHSFASRLKMDTQRR